MAYQANFPLYTQIETIGRIGGFDPLAPTFGHGVFRRIVGRVILPISTRHLAYDLGQVFVHTDCNCFNLCVRGVQLRQMLFGTQ